ncbi:hypothetical protein [Streptomyces olivaceoviridis]|uniref:hypothetical protein n=1 Tax=Streptomyces olivaceoviridis TaxID=1921 RepID=UPI00379A6829
MASKPTMPRPVSGRQWLHALVPPANSRRASVRADGPVPFARHVAGAPVDLHGIVPHRLVDADLAAWTADIPGCSPPWPSPLPAATVVSVLRRALRT